MIPYIRKEKIMEALKSNEIIGIDELHNLLPDVSISTLRRDLKELEKNKKIILLFGGGVKSLVNSMDLPTATKFGIKVKEKKIIAKLASQLINDGETIYLDSGTTCTELMKKILYKKITIVTSNTEIFTLTESFLFNIIFLGGSYNPLISSVNGTMTNNNINAFNFDKAFLGATAVDIQFGVSTPSMDEANKKNIVLTRAKETYLLCDSSKFHKSYMSRSFGIDKCIIISDKIDLDLASKTKMIVP